MLKGPHKCKGDLGLGSGNPQKIDLLVIGESVFFPEILG